MSALQAVLVDLPKGSLFLDPHGRQWKKLSPAGEGVVRARSVDDEHEHEEIFVGRTLRYTCSREEALTDLRERLVTVYSSDPFPVGWESGRSVEYRIELMVGVAA